MGGDDFPDKTIHGIKLFLEKNKSNTDFVLNIFGKEDEIINKLKKYKIDIKKDNINIINSTKIVSDDESPFIAKNSRVQACGIVFNTKVNLICLSGEILEFY